MRKSIFLILLLSFGAHAGDVLLSEDFEKLNLKNLPPAIVAVKDVSIVAAGGERGNVLKLKNAKEGTSALTFMLDLKKAAGHSIKVSLLGQFTGNFEPYPGKTWARPRFQIDVKGKDGKDVYTGANLEPNKLDWQELSQTAGVPKDAQRVSVILKIDWVEAEAFFDNVSAEIVPPDVGPTAPAPPAVAAKPSPASNPKGPASPGSQGDAAKAPTQTLDENGLIFSPEIAAQLRKKLNKPTATPNTYFLVGPGLPNKDYEGGKAPTHWKAIPYTRDCVAPAALGPVELLTYLGDHLAQAKPEVVVMFGDAAAKRTIQDSESFDWSDAIRLCERLGAVPVLAVPPATGQPEKDRLRTAMIDAASESLCPVVDLKAPSNIAHVAKLLDQFVFCRIPIDSSGAKGTGKDGDE